MIAAFSLFLWIGVIVFGRMLTFYRPPPCGSEAVTYHSRVPARSVVVPGTRPRKYPAGEFQVGCALIIGKRSASTDLKTSLNDVLREYQIGA